MFYIRFLIWLIRLSAGGLLIFIFLSRGPITVIITVIFFITLFLLDYFKYLVKNQAYFNLIRILYQFIIFALLLSVAFDSLDKGVFFYDEGLHFLTGFFIALLVLPVFARLKEKGVLRIKSFILRLVLIVALVCLVGVLWEFWEYGMEYFFWHSLQQYIPLTLGDTLSDLFLDISGGALAVWLFRNEQI